mgnify:CR=1 FL=1
MPVGYTEDGDVVHGCVDVEVRVKPRKKSALVILSEGGIDNDELAEDEVWADSAYEIAFSEVRGYIEEALEKLGFKDVRFKYK